MIVNLKFSPDMEDLVLAGKKCCSTRLIKKDEEKNVIPAYETGDQFVVRDRLYEIVDVHRRCVQDVYVSYLSCEGFRTVDEVSAGKWFEIFFTNILNLPREGWGKPCNVYFFAYVGPAGGE